MKYKNLEQIAREADVRPAVGMSRRERLERWASVLAQQPERRLCAIEGTEFGTRPERLAKRADDSPITVAFQDPVLRAAGLRGDRVGDAVDFFELSERSCITWSATATTDTRCRPAPWPRCYGPGAAGRGPALPARTVLVGGLSVAAALGLVVLAL